VLISHKNDPGWIAYYQLCFDKRPAVELYDCIADPDQVNNLALKEEYSQTVQKLRKQLTDYLEATNDPRFTDLPVEFDTYPYNAAYLKKHLQEHGYNPEGN
jgi:hypothetical protein